MERSRIRPKEGSRDQVKKIFKDLERKELNAGNSR